MVNEITDQIEKISEIVAGLLGQTAGFTIKNVWRGMQNVGSKELKSALISAGVMGLPSIRDNAYLADGYGVNEIIFRSEPWNIFYTNSHACLLAATVLQLDDENKQGSMAESRTHHISSLVVPRYLAYVHCSAIELIDSYKDLIDVIETSTEEDTEEKSGGIRGKNEFDHLCASMEGVLASEETIKLSNGIQTLIDGLMQAREQREETIPLTLDIEVPLSPSWDMLQARINEADASDSTLQKCSKMVSNLADCSFKRLCDELFYAGRQLGRGVARLTMRGNDDSGEGIFRVKDIWPDHKNAPLSRLYGFHREVQLLEPESAPRSCEFVLLSTGVLSVQTSHSPDVVNRPLVEFMLGNWRYVDLERKATALAVGLDTEEQDDATNAIYRMLSVAYQLGYHHHGSTLSIDFHSSGSTVKSIPGSEKNNIRTLSDNWGLEERVNSQGLLLPSRERAEPDERRTKNGRLAYVLALRDGLSTWAVPYMADNNLFLKNFNHYRNLDDDVISGGKWENKSKKMGWPVSRKFAGGARHLSAWLESLESDGVGKRLVLCVSQDGYIDAYWDGFLLRIR